ncbi:hypothetical protein AB3X52_11890 [Nocardioides sp. DS6]|uniref:DUF2029 domain-containing protein n=1 Tax=Nocardioides eburneus TaxID=3231482 RepID=A0ABV3SZF2_9ACTN
MRTWPTALAWCLTRAFVVTLLCTQEHGVVGDVTYYRESLAAIGAAHPSGTLTEYPVPALVLLWLPYLLLKAAGHVGGYVTLVATLAVLTDLGFHATLVRTRRWHGAPRSWLGIPGAEWAWLLAVPALGATTYARFDLVPGILVGLAVLYVVHRPAVAAAVGALATGVKYWPALVLPTLAAPRAGRRRVVVTIAVAGLVLAVGSLAIGGWHRLWTPLHYQDERGLQIESVFATPVMLAWGHGSDAYATSYTVWKAYDVSGPLVGTLLTLASVSTLVVALLMAAGWALAWLRIRQASGDASEALVWLVLASVGGFMVTNKVLSPQYLLWLLPAAAAGLVVLERSREGRRRLAWWTGVLLVAAALTHEIFPRTYGYLLVHAPGSFWVVDLLALRNILLVALAAYAGARAGRLLLRAADETEPTEGVRDGTRRAARRRRTTA